MTDHFFNRLISMANKYKSSDIHLQTGEFPYFRTNGVVKEVPTERKLSLEDVKEIQGIVLQNNEKLLQDFNKNKQIDVSYELEGVCRNRINISECMEGIQIVCRIIPNHIPTIDEFKMPAVFKNIASENNGMVLLSGTTGSGKSTTIAAMIEHINQNFRKKIITLEDPIEFAHKPNKSIFSRRELGKHIDSFSNGLKAAMRQDPDIILIGEMRDTESIKQGILAALTGHLVFSTVHAEDTVSLPERIISTFPAGEQNQIRDQIAEVGLAFIAQKLIPRSDKPGRVAAYEILILDASARNVIRESRTEQLVNVLQTRVQEGCIEMTKHLIELHKEGKISKESLIQSAPNKSRAREYAMSIINVDTSEPVFFCREY